MLREDRELLAELKRVSNQAGQLALDCMNGDLPVAAETAYAQHLIAVGEGILLHALRRTQITIDGSISWHLTPNQPPGRHEQIEGRTGMSVSPVNGHKLNVSDNQAVRCVLEMDSDGHIAVIVKPGCSVSDVHDMLGLLTLREGRFEHLTFVDEDDALA